MKKRILIVARNHAEYRDFCRKNEYQESEYRYLADPSVLRGLWKPYQEVWFIGKWMQNHLFKATNATSTWIMQMAKTTVRKDIKDW
jgi:hypothetical protein